MKSVTAGTTAATAGERFAGKLYASFAYCESAEGWDYWTGVYRWGVGSSELPNPPGFMGTDKFQTFFPDAIGLADALDDALLERKLNNPGASHYIRRRIAEIESKAKAFLDQKKSHRLPEEEVKGVLQEKEKDILEVAMEITRGDRQATYGPPDQDFRRTAGMWTACFSDLLKDGAAFEPFHVAVAMILLKASRQTHQRKRDNWIDIAGYSRCGAICDEVANETR